MAALLTFSFVKRKFSCPCQIKKPPEGGFWSKRDRPEGGGLWRGNYEEKK